MSADPVRPPFDRFLVTAEEVVAARPEVDAELVREVFLEVATTLDNGLALDGLDEHDMAAAVEGLCLDLVTDDPGSAIRTRARATSGGEGDLHDPESVGRAYLIAAAMMKL